MAIEHPSPERYKVHRLSLLVSFAGAPTAWAAQMIASEAFSSYACYPRRVPLAAPLVAWLHPALAVISFVCFAAALFAAFVAWRAWRRSRHETGGGEKKTIDVGEGRTRFLALISLYSSGLFLIAILLTAFAVLLVSPCQKWI